MDQPLDPRFRKFSQLERENCQKKKWYRSKSAARHYGQLAEVKKPEKRLYMYVCPVCQKWHLTSLASTKKSYAVSYQPKGKS